MDPERRGGRREIESVDFDELAINKPISISSEIVQQFHYC